jgi:O-antigen/teichoic acid export membrane protein
MNLVLKRTDILMLDLLQGPEAVAYYSMATRLADLAAFGLLVVNMIAAPMISELYNKGNRNELQKMITLAARGIFVLTLLITLILIFGGKLLLAVSGPQYVIGYVPLLILLAGQAVNALSGSVGFIMTMTGYQNQAAIIVASGSMLSILLNALLIPPFGMNGAAIATSITTALWNIAMLIFVIKKLKLNPTVIS